MRNYTTENLIAIPPTNVPAGTLAIKVGESVFKINHLRILNHALWTDDFTPTTKDSYAAYME
jgi:hypothetical protein